MDELVELAIASLEIIIDKCPVEGLGMLSLKCSLGDALLDDLLAVGGPSL